MCICIDIVPLELCRPQCGRYESSRGQYVLGFELWWYSAGVGWNVVCPILLCVLPSANKSREMAAGNTFGATTFCSFGAYWISFSLISTFDDTDFTRSTVDPLCQNELLMGLFMLVSQFHQIQDLLSWEKILRTMYVYRAGASSLH